MCHAVFSCVSSVLASRSIHDASFGRHFCIRCVSTDNMVFRCNAVFYLDAALFSALYVCVSGVPTRIPSYTWQNGLNVSREIMLAPKMSMPAAITHSSWSMLLALRLVGNYDHAVCVYQVCKRRNPRLASVCLNQPVRQVSGPLFQILCVVLTFRCIGCEIHSLWHSFCVAAL